MDVQTASRLVRELMVASTEFTKAANSSRGCKGAAKRERKAAAALMQALTGEKPTEAQLDALCVW